MPDRWIDPRFRGLKAHLAPADRGEEAGRITGEAAVAMICRATDEMEVLLIRRAVSSNDPWSGHMALPGGRREEDDGTILDTAIRETMEETGVRIHADLALGRMPAVSPQTTRIPTVRVTPFVFGVPGDVQATAASAEIDSIYWVGLSELRDPKNQGPVNIPLIGSVREFPAFTLQGQVVWGLTYRILHRFLDQVLRSTDTDPLLGG